MLQTVENVPQLNLVVCTTFQVSHLSEKIYKLEMKCYDKSWFGLAGQNRKPNQTDVFQMRALRIRVTMVAPAQQMSLNTRVRVTITASPEVNAKS